MTGVLVVMAIGVLLWVVPDAPATAAKAEDGSSTRAVLFDRQLLRLNVGIFLLHMVLMAMFVVIPILLVQRGLPLSEHWKIYFPTVMLSFALMAEPLIVAEREGMMRPLFHRLDRSGAGGAARIPAGAATRSSGWRYAADFLHRIQHSGSEFAVLGIAPRAGVRQGTRIGHLQYGAGAWACLPAVRWAARSWHGGDWKRCFCSRRS